MHYFIGIDAGTTNQKAIIFDKDGHIVSQAIRPSPLTSYPDGSAVYDADAVWEQICALLRCVTAQLDDEARRRIAGVAVTGMAEAGVPLDSGGEALYPFVAWYDPRTIPYADWWQEHFSPQRIAAVTGLRVQHIFSVNKLMWLRDNEPDVWRKMCRWCCMEDFIGLRLTGALKMDYSIGSRTMMMDMTGKDWSSEILDAAGVPAGVLPELVPSGSLVGHVTRRAAMATGLAAGTPVFAGGHDHVCGALACGVTRDGVVLDSCGTAEEILVSTADPGYARSLGAEGYNVGCHAAPGLFYMAGGIPASGGTVDWFCKQFPDSGDAAPSKAGANGLLFLPHLRGSSSPTRDPASRGAFLGIRHFHTRADFMQAVYEGLCYEFRMGLGRLTGQAAPEKIVAIGGGTKNERWIQLKADVTGLPIEIPAIQEATALGAAMLAAIGAGAYRSADEAAASIYRVGRTVLPDSGCRQVYDRAFSLFGQLYETLLPLNKLL